MVFVIVYSHLKKLRKFCPQAWREACLGARRVPLPLGMKITKSSIHQVLFHADITRPIAATPSAPSSSSWLSRYSRRSFLQCLDTLSLHPSVSGFSSQPSGAFSSNDAAAKALAGRERSQTGLGTTCRRTDFAGDTGKRLLSQVDKGSDHQRRKIILDLARPRKYGPYGVHPGAGIA